MDISSIINVLSNLFNTNNNQNNNSNNNIINASAENITQQNNLHSNNVNEYRQIDNSHNFPPMFNNDAKQVKTTSFDMPLYPQANSPTQQNQQINSTNTSNIIANILSNPDTLNLIKQILPLLSNNKSNGSGNILSNLLSNFTKKSNNSPLIKKENEQEDFDIDSYIKIDDS